MGKLNVQFFRDMTEDDFRLLTIIETGMRNREVVPMAVANVLARGSVSGLGPRLKVLCKHISRVLSYERTGKYDGYRLTDKGYDYLALRALSKCNALSDFGHQIGTGKESNIYIVRDDDGKELCLKLHRLGRTCFRQVKNSRDYHKNKNSMTWLELSRKSAKKEYTFMKALHDRGFPIPEPLAWNRHCVLMELINGTVLNNIHGLEDVEALYDELMNLIVRFAECGVIHGDFNEFNIMIKADETPVIIDFPQMVSTSHQNAKMYFDRDVECIKVFFRRRFGFESETFPIFEDIEKKDSLDVEVHCSGYTKKMAADFEPAQHTSADDSSDKDEESEEEVQSDANVNDEESEEEAESDANVNVEESEGENDAEQETVEENENDNAPNLEQCCDESKVIKSDAEKGADVSDHDDFFDAVQDLSLDDVANRGVFPCPGENVDKSERGSRQDKSDRLTSCSYLTKGSTIPTSEIQKRVRRQHLQKQTREQMRRVKIKGEASAANRNKQECSDAVKNSAYSIWGLD